MLAESIFAYLKEIEECRNLCVQHQKTVAIHTRGKQLQIYRLFPADELTAKVLRKTVGDLPSWDELPFASSDLKTWDAIKKGVTNKMEKHSRQQPLVTQGIAWEGMPVLVHAYKFEPSPVMKLELVLPPANASLPILPLKQIASALRCHAHLVPDYVAAALAPYSYHETKFITLMEYLSQEMPEKLYATQCLQGVSCHAAK